MFDLIRDNNLFTDVQDQALLLIEFDHDINRIPSAHADEDAAIKPAARHGAAIALLVDHTHSIPVSPPFPLFLV